MAENRLSREQDKREAKAAPKRWRRPGVLPEPNPRKGYVHRWVRVSTLNEADPTNVSSKRYEGWEPCKMSDYPEIMIAEQNEGKATTNIIMKGLMLCRCPEEIMEQRADYFQNLTASQMRSVNENLMKESDPRMPVFNNSQTKSEVFGKGSRK